MADASLYIPTLRKIEGGASNASSDNASKNPSPCTVAGKTKAHTVAGITWTTFVANASSLGYAATCENFATMPDKIWNPIFKTEYWDVVGGDSLKSQAVAELLADMAFNGYHISDLQDYLKKKGLPYSTLANRISSFNILTAQNEIALYNDLIALRKAYYLSLNEPANEEGWLNRIEDIAKRGYALIANKVGSVSIDISFRFVAATIVSGLIIGVGYVVYQNISRKA